MSINTLPPAPPRGTTPFASLEEARGQGADHDTLVDVVEAADTTAPIDFDVADLELDDSPEDEHGHVRRMFTELSQAALRTGTLDRNRHRKLCQRVEEALGDDG